MSTNAKKFTPDAGEFISQEAAEKMRQAFFDSEKKKHNHEDFTRAMFFGKDKIMELLNFRDDIAGLRIYYGIDVDGDGIEDKKMVLYAVDKDGKDILYKPSQPMVAGFAAGDAKAFGGGGGALDGGLPCPKAC